MDGQRKVELLLQLIKGEAKLVDVCREHDLKQSEVESWMDFQGRRTRAEGRGRRMSRPRMTARCGSCARRWANSSWSSCKCSPAVKPHVEVVAPDTGAG